MIHIYIDIPFWELELGGWGWDGIWCRRGMIWCSGGHGLACGGACRTVSTGRWGWLLWQLISLPLLRIFHASLAFLSSFPALGVPSSPPWDRKIDLVWEWDDSSLQRQRERERVRERERERVGEGLNVDWQYAWGGRGGWLMWGNFSTWVWKILISRALLWGLGLW